MNHDEATKRHLSKGRDTHCDSRGGISVIFISTTNAENPVLVYDFQMPEFRSAVKDWGPLWYCGSQGTGGFMVHDRMGSRLCFIMTGA